MRWDNDEGWLEYNNIEHPIWERYGDREFFDENGNWATSATDGYDFKLLEEVGYIHYWTVTDERNEYVLRVPRPTFDALLNDFLYGRGRTAIEEYEEWEHKDGVFIAIRR